MYIDKYNNHSLRYIKFFLVSILFSIKWAVCFSQITYKQTRIPLNNSTGVPFSKPENGMDYSIGGFDIDEKGKYYFSGGEGPFVIAIFDGAKLIFRKQYREFGNDNLYLYGHNLYMFDNRYSPLTHDIVNSLFVLDKSNCTVIGKYKQIVKKSFNSYKFVDGFLIIDTIAAKTGITKTVHLKFNLRGQFIKEVNNEYDLPANFLNGHGQFLGKWNDSYLFCNCDLEQKGCKFYLLNRFGTVIGQKSIPDKQFGQVYYEDPEENRKLRNGTIFVLGREGKSAIITELPVKEIFNIK